MSEDLISWWKKLKHNEKKVLLANFDLRTNKIDAYKDLYVQYYSKFGVGIRKRLDEFDSNQENLQQLIQIEKLVINHISFIDLSIISKFSKLKSLFYSNWKAINLDNLDNPTIIELTLANLRIENLNFVEKLTSIESLKFIYCGIGNYNSLKKYSTLKKLDISSSGGAFDELLHLQEIIVDKSAFYPKEIEYKYYQCTKYKNHQHYRFITEEQQFILRNGSEIQKNNYKEFILSEKYNVYIKDFSVWLLLNNSLTENEKKISIKENIKKNYINSKIDTPPTFWTKIKSIFYRANR